jgi:hypothetical protein
MFACDAVWQWGLVQKNKFLELAFHFSKNLTSARDLRNDKFVLLLQTQNFSTLHSVRK